MTQGERAGVPPRHTFGEAEWAPPLLELAARKGHAVKSIETAYGARAEEYTLKLGCVDQMEPCDAALIRAWGARTGGRILDAGCGPGHWTDLLSNEVPEVIGIDVVPEFIRSARQRYPGVQFATMDMERACFPDGSFAGVLAWYSMIHCEQASVEAILKQFNRLIRAEGSLLLGFFAGPAWNQFPMQLLRRSTSNLAQCSGVHAGGEAHPVFWARVARRFVG